MTVCRTYDFSWEEIIHETGGEPCCSQLLPLLYDGCDDFQSGSLRPVLLYYLPFVWNQVLMSHERWPQPEKSGKWICRCGRNFHFPFTEWPYNARDFQLTNKQVSVKNCYPTKLKFWTAGSGRLLKTLSHDSSLSTNLQRIAYNKTNVGDCAKEGLLPHTAIVWLPAFAVVSVSMFVRFLPESISNGLTTLEPRDDL